MKQQEQKEKVIYPVLTMFTSAFVQTGADVLLLNAFCYRRTATNRGITTKFSLCRIKPHAPQNGWLAQGWRA